MSLESKVTKSISGLCENPKAGNTGSYWERARFLQQISLVLLGGPLPWLWFELQAKNREGNIGFWANHLDNHGLREGRNKSFTCQDLPFTWALRCPLPPVLPAYSFPLPAHLHSPACLPLIELPRLGPSAHAFCAAGQKFSIGNDNGDRGQPLREGYPSASEENRKQQPSTLLLADGSVLAESPGSLQLAWTNEKEPKMQSLWPLKRYFHLWLALRYFNSGLCHWLGTACWQPGHPVVSRHRRRHAVKQSLLLATEGRGRERRRLTRSSPLLNWWHLGGPPVSPFWASPVGLGLLALLVPFPKGLRFPGVVVTGNTRVRSSLFSGLSALS